MGTSAEEHLTAIVDDDAALREAIASLLKSTGFRTESFASAEDFLRSKRRDRAGCLIIDGRLPGMDGLELQQHLVRGGADIPIVFITADEDMAGRMQAQASQAGAIAFLRKPFSDEDLLHAVRSTRAKHT